MSIKCYIDGSARPNPGKGGIGVVITGDGWNYKFAGTCNGKCTNNIAEYIALIQALEFLSSGSAKDHEVLIVSDSEMLVEQMSGRREVLGGAYIKKYQQAKALAINFPKLSFKWVDRRENAEANYLASKGTRLK